MTDTTRRSLILSICLTLLGALLVAVAPNALAVTCATPFTPTYPAGSTPVSSAPDAWSTTDGNVIAADIAYTAGGPYVVIGGNFTLVHNKATGKDVSARNLAVLRLRDGHVMWGATSMTGYPKYIKVEGPVIYVGGSFTEINGVARKAIASFSANTYAMRPWAPTVNGGTIRSIQVSDAGVAYLAGNGGVGAYRTDTGAQVWYAVASAGVVRSVLLSPDEQGLYVGGDFAALAGAPINNLAVIYPIAGGKVDTKFNPHLRQAPTPGGSNAELVLEQRWDFTNPGQLRLIIGTGGSTTNSVQSIDPFLGGKFWAYETEGDTQALTMIGSTILSGYHRSHWNQLGCDYPFFGTQWSRDGVVLPWNPGLNNGPNWKPTTASYLSEANGGISEILVEPQTRKVIVVGDFSFYGGTCDWYTLVCTGGTPRRGLAIYGY